MLESKLKPILYLGTKRKFDNCLHLDDETHTKCLLYSDCRRCDSETINHRDLTQCSFVDRTKFILGDKDHEKVLKLKLSLFLGMNLESYDMDTGTEKITVSPSRKKKHRSCGRNPLVQASG